MDIAPEVLVKLLRDGAIPPRPMSDGSAGFDLSACIDRDLVIPPGEFVRIPTGIALSVPDGFEGEVRPRSGLAAKFGVTLLNSPGTIDPDYRGELFVILINHGKIPFAVENGGRIAQILIKPVSRPIFKTIDNLPETERGSGGFGSTGT